MPFWKKFLIDLLFFATYSAMYHFIGFEITVIIALAQIVSSLAVKDYSKKVTPLTKKSVYAQQGTRWNR